MKSEEKEEKKSGPQKTQKESIKLSKNIPSQKSLCAQIEDRGEGGYK